MKLFLYSTFLVLFLGVIGIAGYVFVQFDGMQRFTYGIRADDTSIDPEIVTFAPQDGIVDGQYTVVPASSTITWSGSRPSVRNMQHKGTVGITYGAFIVAGEESTGTVSLAMQNLTILDEDNDTADALHTLISSPRFFDSEHYPVASFNIIKIEKHPENANTITIFATLEMRGQVRELSFPATVYMSGDTLRVAADFSISRLEWGMTYNSVSILGKLAENAIDDMVGISLDITAVPSAE